MNLPVKLLSFAILATPFVAKADTLDFTLTGGGNTFTFSLPSNPVPGSFSNGVSFTLPSILITEGATSFNSDITFFNLTDATHNGGLLFSLPTAPPAPPVNIDLTGEQSYETTSLEGAPVFAPGEFDLIAGSPKGDDAFTLSIDSEVPEPSSITLLASGVLALAATVRRKLAVS
ncbi:MAG: PEP-CTERM sorting domain-containing protein [Edaphobacter sp.]